jgi:hypothetical protein
MIELEKQGQRMKGIKTETYKWIKGMKLGEGQKKEPINKSDPL